VITPQLFDQPARAVPIRGLPAGWRLERFGPATGDTWFADVLDRKSRRRSGRGITVIAAVVDALTRANTYYFPTDEDVEATLVDWRAAQPGLEVDGWSEPVTAPTDGSWILLCSPDEASPPHVVRWEVDAWRDYGGLEHEMVLWSALRLRPARSNEPGNEPEGKNE